MAANILDVQRKCKARIDPLATADRTLINLAQNSYQLTLTGRAPLSIRKATLKNRYSGGYTLVIADPRRFVVIGAGGGPAFVGSTAITAALAPWAGND
jgi:hypothetical protein